VVEVRDLTPRGVRVDRAYAAHYESQSPSPIPPGPSSRKGRMS
jgi:hypothetical protein